MTSKSRVKICLRTVVHDKWRDGVFYEKIKSWLAKGPKAFMNEVGNTDKSWVNTITNEEVFS